MYTAKFLFSQYDILEQPPQKVIKTEDQLKKDQIEARRRDDLYRRLKEEDPCFNCID